MMDHREFEMCARTRMGKHYGTQLKAKRPEGIPKIFDMVSEDGRIVGDAKYLTLVNGVKLPPAKFMEIAAHVWLLERTPAEKRFLVFGNHRRVCEWWLEKYGHLVQSVEFYFMEEDGTLIQQNQI